MGKLKLNTIGSIAIHFLLAFSLSVGLLLALSPAEPVQAASSASSVNAGAAFACALTDGGGIKCWGRNLEGQLGNGSNTDSNLPVDVTGLTSGVSAISAGHSHACALVDGGVKCWGYNVNGQLGNGTNTDSNVPVDVTGLTSSVIAVYAGNHHTCALTAGGGVKCWGDNFYGQLGDGGNTDSNLPVDVSGLISGVIQVDGGQSHTCALTGGGGVKCWGRNAFGQLGDGSNTDSNVPVEVSGLASGANAVSAGVLHTCALTTGGGAKCWGYNFYGQLGDGSNTTSNLPVDVSGLASGVMNIYAGLSHTCALLNGGVLECWGQNQDGQLGNGTNTDSNLPVDVSGIAGGASAASTGYDFTCAVISGGVKCWGNNDFGQLGDGSNNPSNVPVDVSGITGNPNIISAVSAGGYFSCALTGGGGIKCWGLNIHGQLGDGGNTDSNLPVDVTGLASGVSAISAGYEHACALFNGGVKCWGRNFFGELGNGTNTNSNVPVDVSGLASGVIALDAGVNFTCALTSSGGVKCWGRNNEGMLGNGTNTDSNVPVDVTGMTSGISQVDAGGIHTCALTTGGGVKCWGRNFLGQLGNGSTAESNVPVDVSGLASGVTAVSVGGNHTCALTTSDGFKCWGLNFNGQLGNGTNSNSSIPVDVSGLTSGVSAVSAGWAHTCALTGGGGVKCWGWNLYGQLGEGSNTDSNLPVDVTGLASGISAISAGYLHTCALLSDGVKCWGDNEFGQLGDGSNTDSNVPVDVLFGSPANTAPVAADDAGITDEDSLTGVTVTVLTNDSDPEDDPLIVTEVTQGINGSVSINPDNSLTYVPDPDFNGGDSFSYTVCDDENPALCDSAAVSITVNPVNDSPSFTPGSDVLVLENSGIYSAPWASGITAGPGDEGGQGLAFLVSNDNNALFAAQPAIDISGNLTFTPAGDATGSAVVSVVLQDDGGTANGGVDSSPAQDFTITVQQAANSAPTIVVSSGTCLADNRANGTLNLAVGDAESPAESLTVTATSSNQTLLPDSSLTLAGTGASRTLTLFATNRSSGTAVITILVSDGAASSSLQVTVVVGTNQNETLNGTSEVDVLFGMGGKNTLDGLEGDDLLCGGTKADTLIGGDGNDVLDGGKGNDILNGGNNNDTLLGKAGNDGLTGGSGADIFNGGAGRDYAIDLNVAEGDILIGSIP